MLRAPGWNKLESYLASNPMPLLVLAVDRDWPVLTGSRVGRSLENSADGSIEPYDVIGGELRRSVAMAIGDQVEQLGVVADVCGQVGQPVDHQTPDPGGQVVVADQNLLQMGVP